MPKKNEIELDPKMLDGETVPYPCTGCSDCRYDSYYKKCTKWKKWMRSKWREVTTRLKKLNNKKRKG